MENNDSLACETTWCLLETLTKMGLKFDCPLDRVLKLIHVEGHIQEVAPKTYRRRTKNK